MTQQVFGSQRQFYYLRIAVSVVSGLCFVLAIVL
jgi:hypothetical protein